MPSVWGGDARHFIYRAKTNRGNRKNHAILKHCHLWKDKMPRPPPKIAVSSEPEFEEELQYDSTFFDLICA